MLWVILFYFINCKYFFPFILTAFDIEKDFKLRNYGGNLSLCGPQYSNKVFLSCFFSFFIWFSSFLEKKFFLIFFLSCICTSTYCSKEKSLLPKDIWFNCYVLKTFPFFSCCCCWSRLLFGWVERGCGGLEGKK